MSNKSAVVLVIIKKRGYIPIVMQEGPITKPFIITRSQLQKLQDRGIDVTIVDENPFKKNVITPPVVVQKEEIKEEIKDVISELDETPVIVQVTEPPIEQPVVVEEAKSEEALEEPVKESTDVVEQKWSYNKLKAKTRQELIVICEEKGIEHEGVNVKDLMKKIITYQ